MGLLTATGCISERTEYANIECVETSIDAEYDKIIYCYYENGIVATITNILNDRRHGSYKSFFEDGTLREEGTFENGVPTGTWKAYSKKGKIQALNYFRNNKIIYQKNYDSLGIIISSTLPIKVKPKDSQEQAIIDKPYTVNIILEYSSYENVGIVAFMDLDNDHSTFEDTISAEGRILEYTFLPKDTGHQKIYGELVEGNITPSEVEMVGEYNFEYEYYVASNTIN